MKRKSLVLRLLPSIFTIILLTLFFPLYNQPGVHTRAGFLRSTSDGAYAGGSVLVQEQDGVLTFSGDYLPLTVTRQDDVYTITREEDVLFSGKAPDAEHDWVILADGILADSADDRDAYPVSVAQAIAIASGNLSVRGNSRYLLLALVILAIWCVDILFPNFFFRLDFRQMGQKNKPSPTYRKVQKALWVILPLWGIMCLVMALL